MALRDLNLGHNGIQYLQNRTHGLFEDCLSIRRIDLSHNKVAFVTRKMFPESKWIPYKLQGWSKRRELGLCDPAYRLPHGDGASSRNLHSLHFLADYCGGTTVTTFEWA